MPVSNAISRNQEHQADLYGLNASQAPLGLAEFMIHDADTVRLRPTAVEYALFYFIQAMPNASQPPCNGGWQLRDFLHCNGTSTPLIWQVRMAAYIR